MNRSALRSPHSAPVVLITGASSGIGWATAHLLAKQGMLLALAARRISRLETLAREILDRYGLPSLVLPTDIRRREDVRSMIKKTHDHYGRIDVLVNNAAVLKMQTFVSMPEEDMRDVMETNFWSLVYAIQEAAPYMGKQGGGHIINVGSGVSRRGLPYMAVYSASKFALAGLTESVRLELASSGIAFTSVYPGGVETEMPNSVDRRKLPPGYPDHSRSRITPERAARAIARAIRRRPLEVYVPWWVRPGAWLSALCPPLVDRIIARVQRLKL